MDVIDAFVYVVYSGGGVVCERRGKFTRRWNDDAEGKANRRAFARLFGHPCHLLSPIEPKSGEICFFVLLHAISLFCSFLRISMI